MIVLDYLVRYDTLSSITYYLMSVNHYPSDLINFTAQHLTCGSIS